MGSSVDPGLLLTGNSLVSQPQIQSQQPTIDLGDALKLLANKREKMEETQKLIAEAQLRTAKESLREEQKIQNEKSRWVFPEV